MLQVQTKAPAFALEDENNKTHTLSDYAGQWVVIYFYPKDDTPGCTKEACTIAEVYDEFEKLGVSVLGISKDTPSSHAKFKAKYQLPFTLLSDVSTETIQAYDAWKEKSMYGKKYLGTHRVSYIIDPKGKIAQVYPKVTPADHAQQLLQDLRDFLGK